MDTLKCSRRLFALLAVPVLLLAAPLPGRAQLGINPFRRYDQNLYLGTHNAYSNRQDGWANPNQELDLEGQLDQGVRLLNLDVWLVRQAYILSAWAAVAYESSDTGYIPPGFDDSFLEVVAAHEVKSFPFNEDIYSNQEYPTLADSRCSDRHRCGPLIRIRQWLEAHPTEVVTLTLENRVDAAYQDFITQSLTVAGLDPYVFYLDRPNVGMTYPGRPGDGGWDVTKHGFPTLYQMIVAGRRLVLLPDDQHHGLPTPFRFEVNTVYGTDSQNDTLCPPVWTRVRDESRPVADFTRPLFFLEHAPGVPTAGGVFNDSIPRRWSGRAADPLCAVQNLKSAWHRLPNYLLVDNFEIDSANPSGTTPPDLSVAMRFVDDLNREWGSQPLLAPVATPPPSDSGWYSSSVRVAFSEPNDLARSFVATSFHPDTPSAAAAPPVEVRELTISDEGITTVSVAAIGSEGSRSNQVFSDVRIDRTAPAVTIDSGQDACPIDPRIKIAPLDVTVTATDSLSGIDGISSRLFYIAGPFALCPSPVPPTCVSPLQYRFTKGPSVMFEVAPSAEGAPWRIYQLDAFAKDVAGNQGTLRTQQWQVFADYTVATNLCRLEDAIDKFRHQMKQQVYVPLGDPAQTLVEKATDRFDRGVALVGQDQIAKGRRQFAVALRRVGSVERKVEIAAARGLITAIDVDAVRNIADPLRLGLRSLSDALAPTTSTSTTTPAPPTTSTTLSPPCGGTYPACNGACPAGQSCMPQTTDRPFGCVCGAPPPPCGGTAPACNGACTPPAGCTSFDGGRTCTCYAVH